MNFSAVITQFCNLRCKHCYLPSRDLQEKIEDDLDWESCRLAFINIGNQFGDVVEEVYLTGGEFLTLSYGERVVSLAKECFPNSTIFAYTNGMLFLKDPNLFNRVVPDIFHVGIDVWHGGIDTEGRSIVADRFLEYRENGGKSSLIFHWTRKDGDEEIFQAFLERYRNCDVEIEDRSLNTTTGRALMFDTPQYREDEVWRPCDLGQHILFRYNSLCYSCHYAVPSAMIGNATDPNLRIKVETLRKSALGQVLHSNNFRLFYSHICSRNNISFSANRCLLCEEFYNNQVDVLKEAEIWLSQTDSSPGDCRQ